MTDQNTITLELSPESNTRLASVCGYNNSNIQQIEKQLNVKILSKGHLFSISGDIPNVQKTKMILQQAYKDAESGDISSEQMYMVISNFKNTADVKPSDGNLLILRTPKLKIKGQNASQRHYIRKMLSYDISFGIGPAGTGKTYLAVACAVHALTQNEINRIILVRPAVEAGEKLGFLPGDIGQKVDPYLRPLYDAMYDMLGFDKVAKLIEKNVIEIAPLAYMRGRTLNDAAVILDEAQNTTKEQMKMFLTRVGFGSKAMITGDLTQIDLPKNVKSGLRHASEVLKDIDDIGFSYFNHDDVVRHPLVQKIVKAYEDFDSNTHFKED